jgi:hypothetical protein
VPAELSHAFFNVAGRQTFERQVPGSDADFAHCPGLHAPGILQGLPRTGDVAELADALDLGSSSLGSAGSTPVVPNWNDEEGMANDEISNEVRI